MYDVKLEIESVMETSEFCLSRHKNSETYFMSKISKNYNKIFEMQPSASGVVCITYTIND
jgi:hypothetical protein